MKVAKINDPKLDWLQCRVAKMTWEQATEAIRRLSDDQVLRLLDAGSVKAGDTASYFLSQRNLHECIIDALMRDEIRTAPGRLRAVNTLSQRGAKLPESIPALVKLLDDRSDGVAITSLASLVFFRHRPILPLVEARLKEARPGTSRQKYLQRAKEALELDDPFIYSPSQDREQATRLWKLDEEPYWKKQRAKAVGH